MSAGAGTPLLTREVGLLGCVSSDPLSRTGGVPAGAGCTGLSMALLGTATGGARRGWFSTSGCKAGLVGTIRKGAGFPQRAWGGGEVVDLISGVAGLNARRNRRFLRVRRPEPSTLT